MKNYGEFSKDCFSKFILLFKLSLPLFILSAAHSVDRLSRSLANFVAILGTQLNSHIYKISPDCARFPCHDSGGIAAISGDHNKCQASMAFYNITHSYR